MRNTAQLPQVQDTVKYLPIGSDQWMQATIVSRGGKATGKNKGYFNIKNTGESNLTGLNFSTEVEQWQTIPQSETQENANSEQSSNDADEEANITFLPVSRHEEHEVRRAKSSELENWKTFQVYEEVTDHGQHSMSTRWVITQKTDGSVKARLVARGFEETEFIQSDSPTAGKETLRALIAISSSMGWKCCTIDIKAAFLQGKYITREIYLKPPPEGAMIGRLWKLKKCVYGLNDASRTWYFRVRDELIQNNSNNLK